MEIFSTKAGSLDVLHVAINFAEMRRDPAERRREHGAVAKADFEGEVRIGAAKPDEHYTQVFLSNVHESARQIFVGARRSAAPAAGVPLYGLSPKSVEAKLRTLTSWSDLDPYSETMIRVGLNVPVRYHSRWLPTDLKSQTHDFEQEIEALEFAVQYDGSELRKPIVLNPDGGKTLLRRFDWSGKEVSAGGYFYAQHGVIRPNDLNGLLIRIRQAAVGGYDRSFLGFPTSIGTLFQRWISAEVWADDRLEAAMNIDRKTMRITHPAYVEFQEAIHAFVTDFLKEMRTLIHSEGATERASKKAESQTSAIGALVRNPELHLPPKSRQRTLDAWTFPTTTPADKSLLRTFTVAQLYEIVLAAAAEVMEPRQLGRFLDALTRRLRKRQRKSRASRR